VRNCFFLLCLIMVTGCASIQNVPKRNIVMVNGRGELVDPGPNLFGRYCKMRPLKSIGDEEARQAYYRNVIKQFRSNIASQKARGEKKLRVMVFIHGGLNTQVKTVERAELIYRHMAQDEEHDFFAPIFINWQSSLASTYWDHLAHIRQGKDWSGGCSGAVSYTLVPLYLVSDVVKAVGRAPIVWCMQLANVRHILNRWEKQMRPARSRYKNMPEEYKYEIRQGDKKATTLHIVENMVSTLAFLPVRLVLTPFVDALGSSAWDNMNRGTNISLDNDKDFETNRFEAASGPVAEFIDLLAKEIDNVNDELEVTLVGHSMGAIIINNLIRRYGYELPVSNIVYMAAACSVRDYQDTIFPYMEKKPGVQMYHLVLHDLSEINERLWMQPDVIPRGSLLLWIDNFLAKPSTRLDRTAGRYVNLITADHLTPTNLLKDIHIKQFDYGRHLASEQPQKHGDFGRFTFWREAFWKPKGDPRRYHLIEED